MVRSRRQIRVPRLNSPRTESGRIQLTPIGSHTGAADKVNECKWASHRPKNKVCRRDEAGAAPEQRSHVPAEFAMLSNGARKMPDHSAHKGKDLAGDERLLVERWLGRALSGGETSTLNAYRPHAAPVGDEREALRRAIVAQARAIGGAGRPGHGHPARAIASVIGRVDAAGIRKVDGSPQLWRAVEWPLPGAATMTVS